MISRAGTGVATSGVIGVRRNPKIRPNQFRSNSKKNKSTSQPRSDMGSPIPYQVTGTDISEASFNKINSQKQPIVLKPRENTLAFLLRSKL